MVSKKEIESFKDYGKCLCVSNGVWRVIDLGSKSGTYVNGQPLSYTEKRKLKPMDFIHFADVSYMFL